MVAADALSFTSSGRVVAADDAWPADAPTDLVAASGWLVLVFGTTLLLHGALFDRGNPHSQ
jgi:hypothetical protein